MKIALLFLIIFLVNIKAKEIKFLLETLIEESPGNVVDKARFRTRTVQNRPKDANSVGGKIVTDDTRAYQAAMYLTKENNSIYFCGGTVITQRHILSAAHCCDNTKSIRVILGAKKINEPEATQIRMDTTECTQHVNWNRSTLLNDIAIITLPNKLEFNGYIKAAKLPEGNLTYSNKMGVVSGWGKTNASAKGISPDLKKLQVTMLSNFACTLLFMGKFNAKTNLCANSKRGKSSCNGDSGGPLTLEDDTTLVGVASFGYTFACAAAGYTKVEPYVPWIKSVIEETAMEETGKQVQNNATWEATINEQLKYYLGQII